MGVSPSRLRLVLDSSRPLLSLDSHRSAAANAADDSRRLLDTLVSEKEDGKPMDQVEASLQRQALYDTLGLFLSEEEQDVLSRTFGLDHWDGHRRSHEMGEFSREADPARPNASPWRGTAQRSGSPTSRHDRLDTVRRTV